VNLATTWEVNDDTVEASAASSDTVVLALNVSKFAKELLFCLKVEAPALK
jgi:hypothetical protein